MMHKINKHILFYTTITLFFLATSCISQKKITYFQPTTETSDTVKSDIIQKYRLHLKPGNIISVSVSSISAEANTMFNPYNAMQPSGYQNTQNNILSPSVGYMIDDAGTISLPMVGKVNVLGLNNSEAAEIIVQKLDKYLINPTVNVRMLNYNVSVIGEVNRPSSYLIPSERISLPEMLSLAGDLTIFARRDNVLVIREVDGKREFGRVDLTKRDFFNSPYYYLMPNDVVYVEPGKGRKTGTDRVVQLAPTFISGISLLTVILSIVKF